MEETRRRNLKKLSFVPEVVGTLFKNGNSYYLEYKTCDAHMIGVLEGILKRLKEVSKCKGCNSLLKARTK
jgi:hypothetical protein